MNWPIVEPVLALITGLTTELEGKTGPVTVVVIVPNTGEKSVTTGATGPVTTPPAEVSSRATLSAPCSTTQGFCVAGLMLMTLTSALVVGICHSLKVLSPRSTPT